MTREPDAAMVLSRVLYGAAERSSSSRSLHEMREVHDAPSPRVGLAIDHKRMNSPRRDREFDTGGTPVGLRAAEKCSCTQVWAIQWIATSRGLDGGYSRAKGGPRPYPPRTRQWQRKHFIQSLSSNRYSRCNNWNWRSYLPVTRVVLSMKVC